MKILNTTDDLEQPVTLRAGFIQGVRDDLREIKRLRRWRDIDTIVERLDRVLPVPGSATKTDRPEPPRYDEAKRQWWNLYKAHKDHLGIVLFHDLDELGPWIHNRKECPVEIIGALDDFKGFIHKFTDGHIACTMRENGTVWNQGFVAAVSGAELPADLDDWHPVYGKYREDADTA